MTTTILKFKILIEFGILVWSSQFFRIVSFQTQGRESKDGNEGGGGLESDVSNERGGGAAVRAENQEETPTARREPGSVKGLAKRFGLDVRERRSAKKRGVTFADGVDQSPPIKKTPLYQQEMPFHYEPNEDLFDNNIDTNNDSNNLDTASTGQDDEIEEALQIGDVGYTFRKEIDDAWYTGKVIEIRRGAGEY
jgi:hypothetical protein